MGLVGSKGGTSCTRSDTIFLENLVSYDLLISYRIFSVYQKNTKIIHLIMMIWLVSFIISNYKLASGPPKDPGGSKKIFSKSKDIDS